MKIAKLIILLCIVPLLLTGCKSIDDVKHLTKEQMQRYVQKRIGEEVKLISATGDENGNGRMLYVFNIVDRDIDFDVVAFKTSSGIDGMTIGNYWLEIWIKYAQGVIVTTRKKALNWRASMMFTIEYTNLIWEK